MRASVLSRIFLLSITAFITCPSWVGSQEATIPEIAFLDAFGQPAATVVVGQPARVRVENSNANQDPLVSEEVHVALEGLTRGDFEVVGLIETGPDSGGFQGEIPSGLGSPSTFSGFLEIEPGETVRAEHVFGDLGESVETTALVVPAVVRWVDEEGDPVQAQLESSTGFLRVFDSQRGFPFEVDQVSVEVFSALTGDREVVSLVETGQATFTFEGSVDLRLVTPDTFVTSGDGVLATTEAPGPPFSFDTVRAVYSTPLGQVEDTVQTLGSRTAFVDASGNEADTFIVGERVFVRVEDHNANDPIRQDQVGVLLVSQGGPQQDVEDVVLTETGSDTGVFMGSVPSSADFPQSHNLNLEMFPGSTIFAEHVDVLHLSSSLDEALVTSASVTFVDGAGEPTGIVLYGAEARVRVLSDLENFDPATPEEIGAEVTTSLTGDTEFLLLRETGPDTSVFEGALPVAFSFSGSTLQDGVIQAGESDVLTATFFGADEASATAVSQGSLTFIVDESGQPTETVTAGLPLRVRVVDPSQNGDPLQVEEGVVRVRGLSLGDEEVFFASETGVDTGVFEGEILTGLSPAEPFNDFFEVEPGEIVQADHFNPAVPGTSEDTATVSASEVVLVDVSGNPTSVYLESSTVFLRVFDSQSGFPFEVDQVSVEVFSALTGDREAVTLVETGAATFTFEGSLDLELVPPDGFPSSGDGVLVTTEDPGPPFSFDTVRAVYSTPLGPVEDTARTLGSRTAFVDASGNEAETFLVGERVFVRVEDHNANDPGRQDQVGVLLVSQGGPEQDVEDVVLTETGSDTGVFLGSVPTSTDFPQSQNTNLEMFPGSTIFAEHVDALHLSSSRDEALVTSASVTFVDGAGEPTGVVLYGAEARVRVLSHLENFDPATPEEIGAEVTTSLTGDTEFLLLRETGPDTGVFEGALPVAFSFSGSTLQDGVIQAGESDVLTATFFGADEVSATAVSQGSLTFIVDESGQPTATVTAGRPLRVRVVDPSQNGDPQQVEEGVVRVRGLSLGDEEVIFASETGVDTGVFEGEILTGLSTAQPFNDFFEVEPGEIVQADHFNPVVPGISEATAVVVSGSVEIVDPSGEPATEVLESSRVFFRVFDLSVGSPFQVDVVAVEVFSALTSDREVVQLQETGTETFTFEGSISTELIAPIFAASTDGVLQVTENPGPPFSFDVVRVVYSTAFGEVTDSVPTVGSRVELVDEQGQPVEVYGIGDTVFVRVEDRNVNDPFRQDQTTVFLGIPGPNPEELLDAEEIVLNEVDPAAGVFVGSIVSQGAVPSFFNGTLEVAEDQLLQAAHQDALRLSFSLDTATFTAPSAPPVTLEFLDAAGEPVDVAFHESVLTLRVTSAADNQDPTRAEQLSVGVFAETSGDREIVTVAETGNDTGVFEGSVPLTPSAAAVLHNGLVEVDTSAGSDRVVTDVETVTPDSVLAVSFRGYFADIQNLPIDSVPIDASHRLVVSDPTRAGAESVQIRLEGSLAGDVEIVTVPELSNPGFFQTSILLRNRSATSNNRVLEGRLGEVFTLTYDQPVVGVSITDVAVARTNSAPTPQDDVATTDEDVFVDIPVLENDTDPDGESVALGGPGGSSPENGSLHVGRDASGRVVLRYIPDQDFFGTDTFSYTVRDLANAVASAAVTVTVSSVNDPPIARDDSQTTPEDTPVNFSVLVNDTDIEDPFLDDISSFTEPAHGTVTLSASGAIFQYTPELNFHGTDTFTYTVRDSEGAEATATVTLTVTTVNDPPVPVDDEAQTRENVAVHVPVLANDSDVENDPLAVSAVSDLVGGTAVVEADGTITFTPADNFDGVASFTYTVTDGADSATATVTIVVVDALERTVVLTTGTVRLGDGTIVTSGDLIVNVAAEDPSLFELDLVANVTTAPGWDLKADSLRVGSGSMVESDVDFNELMEEGSILGARTSPLGLPVFAELPPFFEGGAGSTHVEVQPNQTETLAPGAYGTVSVGRMAALVLTGGTYDLASLRLEPEARVVITGATEVRVAGQVRLDEGAAIEPEVGSGVSAAQSVIYVAGTDGAGQESNGPAAVHVGADGVVRANLYVANGMVFLGHRVVFEGAILGHAVETGTGVQLTLNSAFTGP